METRTLQDDYYLATQRSREVLRPRVARQSLRSVYEQFGRLVARIEAQGTSARLRNQQVTRISATIRSELHGYLDRFSNDLQRGINQEINVAVQGHEQGLERLQQRTGLQVGANFQGVNEGALQAMTVRRGLDKGVYRFKSLNRDVINRVGSEIDDFLQFRAGTGATSQQATKELAQIVASGSDDQLLQNVINETSPGTLETVDPELEKWHPRLKKAREVSWKSKRIVRSELGNAYNESDRIASVESPVVGALRWTLSSAHPFDDVCDIYAEEDPHGLGSGLYYPETYPILPHPNCLCYSTKEIRPVSEWRDPKPAPTPPTSITEHQARRVLPDSLSDGAIRREVARANESLSAAHRVHEATSRAA